MTSTDLMGVDAFSNQLPNSAFAALNPETENLADGIGSSYGIIGYKGKVWTLRLRGETYTFTRPDDGSAAPFLDVIVLRSASYKSKSYYPKDSYDGNPGGRPVCSALNGVNPDSDAQQPQAAACAICPRNEWKMVGDRKGRECADYKRLAVLILPSQSKALLGAPLMEPVFLRVPAASLNDLAILGEAMSKKGFHYSTYITRIGFVLGKPHPQMTFRALQALTDKEAPIVLPMREDNQALRITGESEVGKQLSGTSSIAIASRQTQSVSSPVSSSPSTTPVPRSTVVSSSPSTVVPHTSNPILPPSASGEEDDEEAALLAALEKKRAEKAARAAAALKAVPVKAPEPTTVDTGFGSIGLGDSQPIIDVQASPTMAPSVEDTGPAEDADLDLDARVAGLLQR